MEINFKQLHLQSGWHEAAIRNSQTCGCFHCLALFGPDEIDNWIDESATCPRGPGKTALCPHCGIDSVLPDSIGQPLTHELLQAMHAAYF